MTNTHTEVREMMVIKLGVKYESLSINGGFLKRASDYMPDLYAIAEHITKEIDKARENEREEVLSELNIVWVCPPCAKKFFNKGYKEGITNISTAVHRKCEACNQQNQCMHHRSYDKTLKDSHAQQ